MSDGGTLRLPQTPDGRPIPSRHLLSPSPNSRRMVFSIGERTAGLPAPRRMPALVSTTARSPAQSGQQKAPAEFVRAPAPPQRLGPRWRNQLKALVGPPAQRR